MLMIIWMCSVSMKDRRTSKELRTLLGVEPMLINQANGSGVEDVMGQSKKLL